MVKTVAWSKVFEEINKTFADEDPTDETIENTVAMVEGRGYHHEELFELVVTNSKDIPMLESDRRVIPNFKITEIGLGAIPNITDAIGNIGEVHSVGTTKHGFQFNEPLNLYGKSIMCQTVDGMGTKEKIGGLDSFSSVFEEHIKAQCARLKILHDASNDARKNRLGYNLFHGFNTMGTDGNPYCKHILFRFCTLRKFGMPAGRNELHAMMTAITEELNFMFPPQAVEVGSWTLPLVIVMNSHIRYYSELPPVLLGPTFEQDKELKTRRDQNCEEIVKDGVKMVIEGRDDVMKKIDEHWKKFKPIFRCDTSLTYPEDTTLIVEDSAAAPEAADEDEDKDNQVRGFLDI